MKGFRILVAGIMFLFMFSTGASAKKDSVTLHHLTKYETHTQTGNSDFLYNGIFMVKKLQPGYTAFLSYLNKYDVDNELTDSHIANVTVSNARSKRLSLMYSYTNSTQPANAVTRPTGNDSDRWLFLVNYALKQDKKMKLSLVSSFTTATDFSDSRSINEKLKLSFNLTETWSAAISAQYSYNMNIEDNLFNLYTAELSRRLSKTTKFTISYLFVDMQTDVIEDDDIFQGGVFRSY